LDAPVTPILERWENFQWTSAQGRYPPGTASNQVELDGQQEGTWQRVHQVLLETWMNSFMEAYKRPKLRSVEGLDRSVVAFMRQNNLWGALDIHSVVEDRLSESGIDASSRVDVYSDVEPPWIRALVLEFYVKGKSYREILKLWRDAFSWVKDLFTPALAGRVELVFRSA
jgi:hypothetical protein